MNTRKSFRECEKTARKMAGYRNVTENIHRHTFQKEETCKVLLMKGKPLLGPHRLTDSLDQGC